MVHLAPRHNRHAREPIFLTSRIASRLLTTMLAIVEAGALVVGTRLRTGREEQKLRNGDVRLPVPYRQK
jgi:hypothetical protein